MHFKGEKSTYSWNVLEFRSCRTNVRRKTNSEFRTKNYECFCLAVNGHDWSHWPLRTDRQNYLLPFGNRMDFQLVFRNVDFRNFLAICMGTHLQKFIAATIIVWPQQSNYLRHNFFLVDCVHLQFREKNERLILITKPVIIQSSDFNFFFLNRVIQREVNDFLYLIGFENSPMLRPTLCTMYAVQVYPEK